MMEVLASTVVAIRMQYTQASNQQVVHLQRAHCSKLVTFPFFSSEKQMGCNIPAVLLLAVLM